MIKWLRRTWTTLGIGCAASGLLLWLALRQVDAKSLGAAFATVNFFFVLLSICGLVTGLMLRAFRWRVIAGAPVSAHANFSRATYIGAVSNMLLPGRAGEFVRIFTLSRLSGIKLARLVASAIIDRLVDVFVLLVSALGLYFLLPDSTFLRHWLIVMMLTGLIAVIGLMIFSKNMGNWQAFFSRLTERWLQKWKLQPDIFLTELRSEFQYLLSGWLSIKLVVVVLLILSTDCATLMAMLWAFHLTLGPVAALLLWVFLSAGSALPSAPGYVGIYQIAAIWALSFFDVPAASAVALAVGLQIMTLSITLLMSGPSFWELFKSAIAVRDESVPED